METSRDDFVIAIRSAFLKKGNKQRFSLIGLIFFSLIILILGRLNISAINYLKISIKEIIYRSSFIVSVPENYTKETYNQIKDYFNFYKKYSIVKEELEKLKTEKLVGDFVFSENKRLKQAIDDYKIETNEIIAKVLIDKQSPFFRSIVINKGSKDKIILGMAALEKQYLIGKVVEVNYSTSRVLLLSDLNSKIPVIVEPGGFQSILSGTGHNIGTLQYLKDQKYTIKENDLVYTSGSGGIFKAGIPIGKIRSKELDLKKNVNFFSDFSQLKLVKITSFKEVSN